MPAGQLITTVVRGFAAEMTHVATVPEDLIYHGRVLKSDYTGVEPPIATACARTLSTDLILVMLPGTKVRCRQCRRLAGIEVQGQEMWDAGEAQFGDFARKAPVRDSRTENS